MPVGEQFKLRLAKRPWKSNPDFPTMWPVLFDFKMTLLVSWRGFRTWYGCPPPHSSNGLTQRGRFCSTTLDAVYRVRCTPVVMRTRHILTVPASPGLTYYTSLFVDQSPGAAAGWHIDAIELVPMVTLGFPHAAMWGAVKFQCYDRLGDYDGYRLRFSLSSVVCCCIAQYCFKSFISCGASDSVFVYLAYNC